MNVQQISTVDPTLITQFWNAEIGNRFPLRESLWLQNTLNDPNILTKASIVVLDRGKIIGLVVCKNYQEQMPGVNMSNGTGWIQCLLVAKDRRKEGIGTKLITIAEQAFQSLKLNDVKLGRDPQHYFPGIPLEDHNSIRFFEKRGYEKDSIEIDLVRMVKNELPYELTNREVHFRLLNRNDLRALLEFMKASFPGRWHYEATHYVQNGGSGREFLCLFVNGEIKGFCRLHDSCSPFIAANLYWSPLLKGAIGGIGPLGVERSVRGQDFGADIVKAAANILMERGMEHIIIDWTQLEQFYGKLGFKPWKKYQSMSKRLIDLE